MTARATSDKVEEAIAAVRAYWREGKKSLGCDWDRMPYIRKKHQTLTASQRERRHKARQFARFYTDDDLAELFEQCRAAGHVLTIAHVNKLSTITRTLKQDGNSSTAADRTARRMMQRRAIKEKWSRRKIVDEVQRLFGGNRREGAGRDGGKPTDTGDAMQRLHRWCAVWEHLKKQFNAAVRAKTVNLTPEMLNALNVADGAIRKVRMMASTRLLRAAKKRQPRRKVGYDHCFGV